MSADPIFTVEGSVVAAEFMSLLQRATLVGNPAPVVAEMRRQIDNPMPGDRVVVLDSIYSDDVDRKWKGSGVLLSVETSKHEGRIWHVKYGANADDVCRWSNCTVYAIPSDPTPLNSGSAEES